MSSSTSGTDSLVGEMMRQRLRQGAKSVLDFPFKTDRIKPLVVGGGAAGHHQPPPIKGVAYWMHRDQRVQDNWGFLYAQKLALERRVPLHVATLLSSTAPTDPGATERAFSFCIGGLKEVEEECRQHNNGFHVVNVSRGGGGG